MDCWCFSRCTHTAYHYSRDGGTDGNRFGKSPTCTKKAQTIRIQGERLRRLIEDLNLASKLTYDAQPLRKKMVLLPVLMRQIVTDFLNQQETLTLSLTISHDCEGVPICIDEALIERAVRNLIGNSMMHTPPDTEIFVNLQNKGTYFRSPSAIPVPDIPHLFWSPSAARLPMNCHHTGWGFRLCGKLPNYTVVQPSFSILLKVPAVF